MTGAERHAWQLRYVQHASRGAFHLPASCHGLFPVLRPRCYSHFTLTRFLLSHSFWIHIYSYTGANDLANALGPLATVFFIYQNAAVQLEMPVYTWQGNSTCNKITSYNIQSIMITQGLLFFTIRYLISSKSRFSSWLTETNDSSRTDNFILESLLVSWTFSSMLICF